MSARRLAGVDGLQGHVPAPVGSHGLVIIRVLVVAGRGRARRGRGCQVPNRRGDHPVQWKPAVRGRGAQVLPLGAQEVDPARQGRAGSRRLPGAFDQLPGPLHQMAATARGMGGRGLRVPVGRDARQDRHQPPAAQADVGRAHTRTSTHTSSAPHHTHHCICTASASPRTAGGSSPRRARAPTRPSRPTATGVERPRPRATRQAMRPRASPAAPRPRATRRATRGTMRRAGGGSAAGSRRRRGRRRRRARRRRRWRTWARRLRSRTRTRGGSPC